MTLPIAAVPYLNAQPLYTDLNRLLPVANLRFLPPAEAARALRTGRCALGLVPVFALLESGTQDLIALPDLGICAKGEVLSVYVAAKKPFDQIKELYLDPESRSSAALVRVLAQQFLPKDLRYLATFPGYEKDIQGERAGLIIGDRALEQMENFPYRLDLGKAWFDYTGLPFVFALWAIRREAVTPEIVAALREAALIGESRKDEIARLWAKAHRQPAIVAENYLQKHIYYRLHEPEHQGLKRFIDFAAALELIHPHREIVFYESTAHHRSSPERKSA